MRFLAIPFLLSALTCPALPPAGNVTLAWDYPAHGTNISFNLYMTTNLVPANWVKLTNIVDQQVTVKVVKQVQFFTVTATDSTNFWAESDFSNAVGTPVPPPAGSNFHVGLAP
jgi:hypothetical protein